MLKAYKTQLDPNNIQITKMKMNCGAARWAFNFALNRKKETFDKKEKIPNNIELHRELNKLKGTEELSWAISDVGMFEFRRQIEYKVKWQGKLLVIADRFYPSSKMDWKSKKINKDLTLKDRVIYHEDGTTTDRDLNAAINLEHFYTLSSREIYACGDGSSSNFGLVSLSEKQESNRKSDFRFL